MGVQGAKPHDGGLGVSPKFLFYLFLPSHAWEEDEGRSWGGYSRAEITNSWQGIKTYLPERQH